MKLSFTTSLAFFGALCIAATPFVSAQERPSPVLPEHKAEPDLSMRPQPVIERSIEERLAWGRDIIGRLNLDVSNLDSLEAAVALRTLASFSNNLICGTVTHLSTHWSELDNIRFPLTKFSIEPFAAAIPIEEPQVEVRFLGGEIDGRNYRTEATPEVASGDRVCVLINDVGGKHWLTGINAYLEIRDGIVGLGQVRSDTATFIAAFSDLVNER